MPTENKEKFSFDNQTLGNPPIIEAIFEIRWRVLGEGKTEIDILDKKFKFFPGRFYEKIKDLYPEVEVLPNVRVPDEMDFYLARYRFRKHANGYPLIQIGPGILTVNLDKNFSQKLFYDSSIQALNFLYELIPEIKIVDIQIHYIDGIEFNDENGGIFEFLSENLHTHFNFSPDLFEATKINPRPIRFHLESYYQVEDPVGFFMCQLRSGLRKPDKKKMILMDTIFRTNKKNIPQKDEIPEWIRKVDNLIHIWFFKMIEKIQGRFE